MPELFFTDDADTLIDAGEHSWLEEVPGAVNRLTVSSHPS
jgi:hypothetical protein